MTSNKKKKLIETNSNNTVTELSIKLAINKLVEKIKTNDKVRQHSVLHCEQWNKGCYNLLSDIILDDLSERMTDNQLLQTGSSISAKTLQKIVEGNYQISMPIDPRRINTLNKLTFFIGYDTWDGFLMNLKNKRPQPKTLNDDELQLKDVIVNTLKTEFAAYLNLPKIPVAFLSEVFIEGSQAFNKIMEVLLHQQKQGCTLANQYNPSTFELLNYNIEKFSDEYAQISTTEYWELCWWNVPQQQYLKRYKNISKHVYVLVKIDGQWKVKTNASTADFLQTKENNPVKEINWNQMGNSNTQSFSKLHLNK